MTLAKDRKRSRQSLSISFLSFQISSLQSDPPTPGHAVKLGIPPQPTLPAPEVVNLR